MSSIGYGPLPDPTTIDPNVIGQWITPAELNKPTKRYKLINGAWFLQLPEAWIEHDEPVALDNGTYLTFNEVIQTGATGIVLSALPQLP